MIVFLSFFWNQDEWIEIPTIMRCGGYYHVAMYHLYFHPGCADAPPWLSYLGWGHGALTLHDWAPHLGFQRWIDHHSPPFNWTPVVLHLNGLFNYQPFRPLFMDPPIQEGARIQGLSFPVPWTAEVWRGGAGSAWGRNWQGAWFGAMVSALSLAIFGGFQSMGVPPKIGSFPHKPTIGGYPPFMETPISDRFGATSSVSTCPRRWCHGSALEDDSATYGAWDSGDARMLSTHRLYSHKSMVDSSTTGWILDDHSMDKNLFPRREGPHLARARHVWGALLGELRAFPCLHFFFHRIWDNIHHDDMFGMGHMQRTVLLLHLFFFNAMIWVHCCFV